jgi:hypothetical protein
MWPRRIRGVRGLAVRSAVRPMLRRAMAAHMVGLAAQVASNAASRQALLKHGRELTVHKGSVRQGIRGIIAGRRSFRQHALALNRSRAALGFHANGARNTFLLGRFLGIN